MRIDTKQRLCGLPSVVLRKLLRDIRSAADHGVDVQFIAHRLKLSMAQARTLVTCLANGGYIESRRASGEDTTFWCTTVTGSAFAIAKMIPPITREKAEHILEKFLERVNQVNNNPCYLTSVYKVVVFGSYLSDTDILGDIDLALGLSAKEPEWERYLELTKKHVRKAKRKGRRFSGYFTELSWPEDEAILFLKSRERYLSFSTLDDPVCLQTNTKVFYEQKSAPDRNR
ncbi:MAG: hypothetical protein ACYDHY_15915 [Acidiferrobacterales bacterium]